MHRTARALAVLMTASFLADCQKNPPKVPHPSTAANSGTIIFTVTKGGVTDQCTYTQTSTDHNVTIDAGGNVVIQNIDGDVVVTANLSNSDVWPSKPDEAIWVKIGEYPDGPKDNSAIISNGSISANNQSLTFTIKYNKSGHQRTAYYKLLTTSYNCDPKITNQ